MANEQHAGGGFNIPEPTTKGGPDFGRFVAGLRDLQNRARTIDAPDEVITEAAELLNKLNSLLDPYDGDEWTTPSGRRFDLPQRGGILGVPTDLARTEDGRVGGTVRFGRFYLGRNGAVHGGALGLLFDSVMGFTAAVLTGRMHQRTAYLHIDYRKIVPVERTLRLDAGIRSQEGRKIFVEASLYDDDDGGALLTEANALFVKLKPGQP
ncbi:PaaI family thioesterase [Mycobacterium sp. ACS4331]|uniref:PaaI family thioesterase n=1 Tax=Mycobacterium sp. ACS4331 TaxID=1834121 RepID=UPI0008003017|nr:PaaI family thioesterase [Mycobacterium sp. ACS4331]OBF21956.1 thioesterase [Mycobacterium sp. ACS4331]